MISFCLTGANVDDRDSRVWTVFAKVLYGKVFADRGYIKQELFENLLSQGIQLVHGLKARMKNKLMPTWDKIMLRKISSSASMNFLRTKRIWYTHDIVLYITLS